MMLEQLPALPDHHWPPIMQNRRGATRFSLAFPTRYHLQEDTGQSLAVDVSASGIRLDLDRPLPIGTRVRIELQPGSSSSFSLDAAVVWSRPSWKQDRHQAGFTFVNGSSEQLRGWLAGE